MPDDEEILVIRRLVDEGTSVARFCLLDSKGVPFVDPFTLKNTWTRAALNRMLRCNNWRAGKTRVRHDYSGYEVYKDW